MLLNRFLEKIEFESYEDFKNNYRLKPINDFNFGFDVVDAWADNDPNKKALIWTDDHENTKEYTFLDIKRYSNKCANYLESLGIGIGDKVLLILKQRPEVWFTFTALHKMGAICIPATYQLTKKDIVYRCNAAKIKAIICVDDNEVVNNISDAIDECKTVEHLIICGNNKDGFYNYREEYEKQSEIYTRKSFSPKNPMLIYFSSGTTGMPKMIMHDFFFPLGHIVTAKYWQQVEENKLHLTMSDSGWAKFAWGKIYGQWICGATILAYDNDKFNAKNTLDTLVKFQVCTFCAPPTIFRFLIKEDLSEYDLSFIKHAAIAGEPLNPEVWRKFKEITGLSLTEGFGQTETPVLLANFPWLEIKPGSTGKPSPLYDVDIIDDNGNSCEDGVVGRIVIKNLSKFYPKGLIKEYVDDPDANAKSFYNDCYDTGDTAWRDSDGYYWFEGRSDDVIKCSGYRIGPFEVESALMTHPSVLECAVTAAPDPIRGQVVKATIVLAKGFNASDELKTELQKHVKKVTAPYKYPRVIEFVKELPKTTSGKIKRADIRKQENA